MKKIIGLFFMIAIYGSTHFSAAQMMLKLPYDHITDEPIGIDLTLKTAKLQNGVELQYAEQGLFTGTPVIFLHGISDSWHSFESVLPFLPPTFMRLPYLKGDMGILTGRLQVILQKTSQEILPNL